MPPCTTRVVMAIFLEYCEHSVKHTQNAPPLSAAAATPPCLLFPEPTLPLRVSLHTGMVRLSELRSTAQNSRPTRTTAALPDSIITQREEAQSATEEEEEAAAEPGAEAVEESRPRRRRPARGRRQKDFDLSEQHESSDEENQQRARARAAEEPWTQNQQKLLELALQQYPRGSSDRWDKIAKCVPSKSKVGDAGKAGLWGLQTQGSGLWPHLTVPHLTPPPILFLPNPSFPCQLPSSRRPLTVNLCTQLSINEVKSLSVIITLTSYFFSSKTPCTEHKAPHDNATNLLEPSFCQWGLGRGRD